MQSALDDALRRASAPIIGLTLAVALCGCTTRGGSVPYERADFGPPDVEALTGTAAQQRIAPYDKLRIRVFQVEDLSGDFRVDGAGKLQFPLIGDVPAQGMSPEELAEYISAWLGERHLQNPDVSVTLTERTEQTITVDGAVQQPGVLPIEGATTLMRAVAMGRGLTPDANPARVVVFRTINGQRMAAAFDLREVRRAEAEDPAIYGNDIVIVEGSRIRSIWRDVAATIPLLGVFRPY